MSVPVFVPGVGSEYQSCEKADVEADKSCDRVPILPGKRGEDRDTGGDVEHITAEQPTVEIAVLALVDRCVE